MRHPESRLDEGYSGGSPETRSPSDSDANMQLDPDTDMDKPSLVNDTLITHLLGLPTEERTALVASLILGLPECERSDTAYAVVRSLRISSIASIVDRLNPLLHRDPAMILPPEITALIFLYLPPVDLLRSALASRPWRERALDSNLWRVLFTREGWSANIGEIKAAEDGEARRRLTADRNSSPKASRRKRDGEPERTGSFKRARESPNHNCSQVLAESVEGWREQHGTPEADEDLIMNDGASPSAAQRSAFEQSLDHDDESEHQPSALFTSDPESPRVDWLYLYKQRRRLEDNWHKGRYVTFQLPHPDHPEEAHEECVYTIQHSRKWLVSGSRDKTIVVWNLDTQRRVRTLSGAHVASVLCLQFDERESEDIVVSGGSDSFVVVWRFSTGEVIRKMDKAHTESILNLRFDHRYLITCSKDKTIKIWNRHEVFANDPIVPAVARRQIEIDGLNPIPEYSLLVTLDAHNAAVNAIQVHERQIVSASGDRTIRAWDINTGHCIRTYTGHTKGIACVQYDGRRIVSGSSDNTVRIFDAATAAEVACLSGHTNLVRTVQARFGDMHDTDQDLEAAARAVDQRFREAQMNGEALDQHRRRGIRNAGSSNPSDVCAIGAKIPPGGGGNSWSRIVSGSYDETIIIWRKEADGKWVQNKRLHQDEVLQARSHRHRSILQQPHATPNSLNIAPHQAHQQAVATNGVSTSAVIAMLADGQLPPMSSAQAQTLTPNLALGTPSGQPGVGGSSASANRAPTYPPVRSAHVGPVHHGHNVHHATHGQHRARENESNRVFKLQFDSRRIISCSQNRIIVGWDFAAGDSELADASRFFGETN